ncbi:uncharacterized protein LOC124316340 isoform X2 [Daphnia pulicaria]|uniref:uncharacterized protein LOC124316340 isoform X2 n=1 Tax=Daphnia pulicaria TaxID=35523 RepID=UPI001EE9DC19|nr:uncharacterized protein LOC124316340 isoform X2 [Daphnia pulicaria]
MDEEQTAEANITLIQYDFPVMEQNITTVQTLFRTSVICVGILLNCVVLSVVTFSRQLHCPRHIFCAAISIFECLFLVDSALELVTVHKHDYLACRFVVLFYPVDYSILLICMSLAALDRYLSIVRYEWYQANATNRGAIVSITIAIFIETKTLIRLYVPKYRRKPVTVKFENKSFIRQPSNISSEVNLESKLTAEQVLFSIAENASGVREGNPSIISQDPEIILPSVVHHQMDTDERDQHSHLPPHSTNNQDDTESFRMPGRSKISRLEVQAALNLSVNILPFWLCTLPVACYAIVSYLCIQLDVNLDTIVVTWNYFWDTFMLHSIYNPIMYMATCSEFRRALRHTAKKLSTKFCFVLRK